MANSQRVYFDSALIAKFYLNERGQRIIRSVAADAGAVLSSELAIAEVSAAFHRKLREGSIKEATFMALQGQFAADLGDGLWTLLPVTRALLYDVSVFFATLHSTVFVRSADALHLMTAKAAGFQRLHSNDRHLMAACSSAALDAVNPLADET